MPGQWHTAQVRAWLHGHLWMLAWMQGYEHPEFRRLALRLTVMNAAAELPNVSFDLVDWRQLLTELDGNS